MSDAREQPAVQPPKKRMSRGTRVLVIIVCILLAIALILAGTVLAFARALGEYGATSMVAGYTPGKTATVSTTV